MIATAERLDTLSPAEIDERLSVLYQRRDRAYDSRDRAEHMLHGVDFRGRPMLRSQRDIEHYEDVLREAEAEIAKVRAEQIPFDEEFTRRGGWNRCFLVTNANGHVHSTMACSTCYPTTRFGWLTEWSGKSYEEIVNDAAERACTVCYPDAPVEKKSVMFTAEERADQQRREQERQAREVKKAEKAAKAITAPNGSMLRDGSGYEIKTERTAQINAVDDLVHARVLREVYPRVHAESGYATEERIGYWKQLADEHQATAERLIVAIAAKRSRLDGMADDWKLAEVRAELQKKADAKYRRDYR